MLNSAAFVLMIAALLDYLIGDPWQWVHPVQVIGWVIARYTQLALQKLQSPLALRWVGIGLTIGVVLGSGTIGWLMAAIGRLFHPLCGIAIESLILASCLAGRSLRQAAEDVLQPLATHDIVAARAQLRRYVGRDTETLSQPEILRAVLETVTENATDGVLAPLFYALVGLFIPAIGSMPLALAYKAASTLDSMVGYRKFPYTDIGWCSAKTDDVLTWLPCRLVVCTLALFSGTPKRVLALCQRDAVQDPSPNSGWSECAYAAVLGVQVGGTNFYQGVAQLKPLLGESTRPITPAIIRQAMGLTRYAVLLWGAIGLIGWSLWVFTGSARMAV